MYEHLSKWEFGIVDMPDVVDLMDRAFEKFKGTVIRSWMIILCLVSSTIYQKR